jgi:hypothetical protein
VIACEGKFRMNDRLDKLARTLAALLAVAADFQGFVVP